jgi:hypothetical protein
MGLIGFILAIQMEMSIDVFPYYGNIYKQAKRSYSFQNKEPRRGILALTLVKRDES